MAVEDAEAPGGEDEEPGAGKEDTDEIDRQLALCPFEAGSDQIDQQRRGQNAEKNENRCNERQNRRDRTGHPSPLLLILLRQKPRIDRNERCREHPFAEEILQEVRYPEGGLEGIGGDRVAEIMSKNPLAYQSGDPAQQNPGPDEERRTAGAPRLGLPLDGTLLLGCGFGFGTCGRHEVIQSMR
jgi:hypothetical protein